VVTGRKLRPRETVKAWNGMSMIDAVCVEGEDGPCLEKPIWFPFTDPKKGVCMTHYGQNHLGEIRMPSQGFELRPADEMP